MLSPETCLGSVFSLDVFSRLVMPLQTSKTDSEIITQAAGKGVILPSSKEQAHAGLKDIMLAKEFGSAGDEVVIEEFLQGDEISILSFSDGYTIKSLPCGVRTFRSKCFLFGKAGGTCDLAGADSSGGLSQAASSLRQNALSGPRYKICALYNCLFFSEFFLRKTKADSQICVARS